MPSKSAESLKELMPMFTPDADIFLLVSQLCERNTMIPATALFPPQKAFFLIVGAKKSCSQGCGSCLYFYLFSICFGEGSAQDSYDL